MVIYNIEYNELIFHNGDKINFNLLPSTIKILRLPDIFNEKLEEGLLPESLEVLVFGCYFNQQINKNILPANLKVIIFGNNFNQILEKYTLPANLQILKIFNYTQPIKKNVLPKNLKILEMENTHITVIESFLENLKKIMFYSTSIDDLNILPKGIEFLILKIIGTHSINLNLPNLKILKIGSPYFNIFGSLPPTLKYIEFFEDNSVDDFYLMNCWRDANYKKIPYKNFPCDLEYLVLNDNIVTFENNNDEKNKDILDNDNIIDFQDKLKNLKYLSIDGQRNQENILNNLPTNLSIIKFTNLKIEINNLPISLEEIYLERDSDIQYLKKIPFGCTVHTTKKDVEIIENYLINSKYTLPQHPKSILNNILNLDDIGTQYYSIYH